MNTRLQFSRKLFKVVNILMLLLLAIPGLTQKTEILAAELYELIDITGSEYKINIYGITPPTGTAQKSPTGIPVLVWVATGVGGGITTYILLTNDDPSIDSGEIIANDDQLNIPCNGSASINVLANDIGSNIEVVNIVSNSEAEVVNTGNGNISISNVGTSSFSFNYTITDDQNQTAQATVTVTVIFAPIISNDDSYTFEIGETVSGNVINNDSGDNIQILDHSEASNGVINISANGDFQYVPNSNFCGQEAIRYSIVDDCGQESSAIVHLTGNDNEVPTVNCPVDVTIECNESNDPSNTGEATAEDNCSSSIDISISYDDNTSGLILCSNTGTITRIWTATDDGGNSGNCNQEIKIQDTVGPEITCPAEANIECGSDFDPEITGEAHLNDLCGETNLTYTDDITGLGECSNTGIVIREWLGTDECGNISQCNQTIRVLQDQAPPVISCPSNAIIFCGSTTEPSSTGFATASDNCLSQNQIIIDYVDSLPDTVGCNPSLLRIWTAIDSCGNEASCQQSIFIEDQSSPLIICPPDTILNCNITPNPDITGVPRVTDDCGNENVELSYIDELFPDGPCAGIIIRHWTATDSCGNSASCIQNIVLELIDCDFTYTIETNDSSCGINDGMAEVTVSQGPNSQGPYSIEWSDGQIGNLAVDLDAGFYQVTITDEGINCNEVIDFQIFENPPDIVADVEVIPISCSSNGDIIIELDSPGSGPIDIGILFPGGGAIGIPNFPNNSTFYLSDWINPFQGEFTFTFTDQSTGSNCEQTIVVELPQTLPITISLDFVIPPSNPNGNDGQIFIDINPISGVPPFDVFVNDIYIGTVDTYSFVINGVPAGFYVINIIDALSCFSNFLDVIVPAGNPIEFSSQLNQNVSDLPEAMKLDLLSNSTIPENSNILYNNLMPQWNGPYFVNNILTNYSINKSWMATVELTYINSQWHIDDPDLEQFEGSINRLIFSPFLKWIPENRSKFIFSVDFGAKFYRSDVFFNNTTGIYNFSLIADDHPVIFGRVDLKYNFDSENTFELLSGWVGNSKSWNSHFSVNFKHQFGNLEKYLDIENRDAIQFKPR